jgi:SAM-dependent methyltransferase
MSQADIFLNGEGDAWFIRNKDRLGIRDPVSDIIEQVRITPTNVLEIGCANGWRLAKLRDRYGCKVLGVEPSMAACIEAAKLKVPALHSTAATLPTAFEEFDLVIYGFCLYLTDPSEWFRIVAEGDMVLKPGGHLIVHDFETFIPHSRKYEHCDGVLSYHVEFARMFLSHPLYHLFARRAGDDDDMVTVLKKSPAKVLPRPT